MKRSLPVVALLLAGTLAAQEGRSRSLGPSLRLQAGMLNPSDPLQVTLALGAAAGVRVGRFGLLLGGLRQSKNHPAGGDLKTDARTFWGLAVEYSTPERGLYRQHALAQIGAGRLSRSRYRTTWYVHAGLGLRYPVASRFAFLGYVEDDAAFLPDEPARCEPPPGDVYRCTEAIVKQVQHNFGFVVALEFVP